MNKVRRLTIEDIREINQRVIEKKSIDFTNFSPASIRILKNARFTAEDINKAYAVARKKVESL